MKLLTMGLLSLLSFQAFAVDFNTLNLDEKTAVINETIIATTEWGRYEPTSENGYLTIENLKLNDTEKLKLMYFVDTLKTIDGFNASNVEEFTTKEERTFAKKIEKIAEKKASERDEDYSDFKPSLEEFCEDYEDQDGVSCEEYYNDTIAPMYSFTEIDVILVKDKNGSILGARSRMINYNGTDDGDDDTYIFDYYDAKFYDINEFEYNP